MPRSSPLAIFAAAFVVAALFYVAKKPLPSAPLPENEILILNSCSGDRVVVNHLDESASRHSCTDRQKFPKVFIVRDGEVFAVTADMVNLPPVVTPEENAASVQKAMKAAEDYGPGF